MKIRDESLLLWTFPRRTRACPASTTIPNKWGQFATYRSDQLRLFPYAAEETTAGREAAATEVPRPLGNVTLELFRLMQCLLGTRLRKKKITRVPPPRDTNILQLLRMPVNNPRKLEIEEKFPYH